MSSTQQPHSSCVACWPGSWLVLPRPVDDMYQYLVNGQVRTLTLKNYSGAPSKPLLRTAVRTALAGLMALAVYQYGYSLNMGQWLLPTCLFLSPPACGLAFGTALYYTGIKTLAASLSALTGTAMAKMAALGAMNMMVAHMVLYYHDVPNVGLIERAMNRI
jgi:hypothetical protein